MKNWITLISILGLLSFGMYQQNQQTGCSTSLIHADTAQFKSMLDQHDGIIIDVRTPEEYRTGYIKGAINIDFRADDFKDRIGKLDKTKTYYIYCEIGGRSAQAGDYMVQQGFCRVVMLERGLRQWKAGGFPLVTVGGK
jgi:rhodanese-related sulfurtransferase